MPKKRIIGIDEIITETNASAGIKFDIDASDSDVTMFFNQGGYSFLLEDSKGSIVRFWYVTSGNTTSFFRDDNDLQPRYANEDSNSPYFDFNSETPFFGSNTSNVNDITNLYLNNTPVRINVSDLINFLDYNTRDNNPATYKAVITAIVERTIRAINYVEEVQITATGSINNDTLIGSVSLIQQIAGPSGNTVIDRNENADEISAGFYGILTDDIVTENFTGGAVNDPVYENIYSTKSGSVSNSLKKELNRKSSTPGFYPSNKITTGKKVIREKVFFDDSLTCIYENKLGNNSIFGLPVKSATIDNKEELFFAYSNIDENTIFDNTQNKFKNEQLLLRNSGIYSKPNDLNISLFEKESKIQQNSIDNFIEQKRVIEEYTPYEEDFGYFISTDTDFETKNIENNIDYNISSQKQIKISLNFGTDAFLSNTAIAYNDIDTSENPDDNIHYTNQFNFLKGNKKAVSSNIFSTAYWNFNSNNWEYLDINSKNISPDGFVNPPVEDTNYTYKSNVFPSTANSHNFTLNDNIGQYDFRQSVKDNLLNRPICFSPSYRYDNNSSHLMQPTTSYGFPQKVNWQPHDNHILKMSDYIDENFILEKIIIKGKISANFEKPVKKGNYGNASSLEDFNTDYSLKQLSEDYLNSIETLGFSFFILNQRKNADIINKKHLTNTSYFYTQALKNEFDSGNVLINDGNDVYSESIFLNNNEVKPYLADNAIYQFDNNHADFYNVNISNNVLSINENLKNKFYTLGLTSIISNNKHEQFLIKEIEDWEESTWNEDLSSGAIKSYNINDAYPDGVQQKNVSRELVSFSNLLLVNSLENNILELEKFKNIDNIIQVNNNSISETEFIINSNLKNYDSSSFIDESKYSILSNKTNTYVVRQGSPQTAKINFTFDYNYFAGTLSNFKNNINDFYFSIEAPEDKRFYINFTNNPLNNNAIYISGSVPLRKNYFNLDSVDFSSWKDSVSHPSETENNRAGFNFLLFTSRLYSSLNNSLGSLVYVDNTQINENIGKLYLSDFSNDFNSNSQKEVTLNFEAVDESIYLYDQTILPLPSLSLAYELNNPVCTEVSTSITFPLATITNEQTLHNNLNVLEGYSKGRENFVDIQTERILNKTSLSSKEIGLYSNNINYSFYKENTRNSIVNTNYLLKPEDELIFGINSYGNGDLIASLLQLHDNLDIILIGRTQSKEKRERTNESKSITKVLKGSNVRKTNIEGTYLINKNYFSNVFNTNNFLNNKKVVGDKSSNSFGNWCGFIDLVEESNISLKTHKKFYYDSVLPNLIDLYTKLCEKNIFDYEFGFRIFLDDENIESEVATNSDKILFKENWLQKYPFNDFVNFDKYRNIDNTINGSLKSNISNIDKNKTISVVINKSSYEFNNYVINVNQAKISTYTLPITNDYSNDVLPLKIQNNSKYDFIENDSQIEIDTNRLDNYSILISIQKPRHFNKWIIVVNDEYNSLNVNSDPIFSSFSQYLIQGDENDYMEIGTTGEKHLVSSRTIPLTLFDPIAGIYFSKSFRVFYGTENKFGFDIDAVKLGDHSSVTKRKFYSELEYWEILKENYSGFDELSDSSDRPTSFGGENAGFPRNSSVYPDLDNFVTYKIQQFAYQSNQILQSLDSPDDWHTIYDFGDTIGDSEILFFDSPPGTAESKLSISRYKLINPYNDENDYPVLIKKIDKTNIFNTDYLIENSIQTYLDKSYLEDDVEKLINFDLELEKITNKNSNIILNEKIYVSDSYFLQDEGQNQNFSNINKTGVKFIYKYIKNKNNLNFPYIQILAAKTNSGLLQTNFIKSFDSIFLNKKGKIRIYEQNLLDIHNETGIIQLEDVPYFDIVLQVNENNQIEFDNLQFSSFDQNDLISGGSKLFTIKNVNKESELFSKNYLLDVDNHDQHDDFNDRDRKINNFIYSFGKRHDELSYLNCKGYKFGVLNGHKTSPTYKFSAYSYGQFADFISYSTNTAYIKNSTGTKKQVIEYASEKVFVDSYYNVVNSSENTFNKDIYSRCSYPYIENKENILSQLNEQNPNYKLENVF